MTNERNKNKIQMLEKDRRRALDREILVYCQPRAIRYLPGSQPCTQTRGVYHAPYSPGFQFTLTAQSTPLSECLGWPNQRGSKTSQAWYSHPRCDLNLVRLFRFSLLLTMIGRIFFLLHPRGHKPTAPFVYYAVPYPRVKCGDAPVPHDAP